MSNNYKGLTQEQALKLFYIDQGCLRWAISPSDKVKAKDKAGYHSKYTRVKMNGVNYYAHRIVWLMTYGVNPEKDLDHIDGDASNNSPSNLRMCTRSENMRNRAAGSKNRKSWRASKYKGVKRTPESGWNATIVVNKKAIHLGSFSREVSAAKAYNEAAIKYFGEFAKLNIIE